MKFTKKFAACVLALMIIVCSVAFSVSAAEAEDPALRDNDTAAIVISASDDGTVSVANKTFDLYRIFNATVSAGAGSGAQPNVSYTWNIPTGKDKSPFYDFFFTSWATDSEGHSIPALCNPTGLTTTSSANEAVDYIAKHNSAAEMADLAHSMLAYIAKINGDADPDNNILPDVAAPTSTSATNIVYGNIPFGYYLIAETSAKQNESDVRSAPILISATSYVTVNLKATKPSIDKNIVGLNVTEGYDTYINMGSARANEGYRTPTKGISATAGDTITYAITFKVPDTSDFENYTFNIKDEMPTSLDFVDGSLSVYVDKKFVDGPHTGKVTHTKEDYPNDNYWINSNGAIEFNFNKIGDDGKPVYPVTSPAAQVTVLYKALLLDTADRVNTNKVKLTYSSDPADASKTSSVTSSAYVYTYQLVFGKYVSDTDGNATGVALPGAQFELYDENGNIIHFKPQDEPGTYAVTTSTGSDVVTTLEVLANYNEGKSESSDNLDGGKLGQFKILGLGDGIYKLREIKAPDGYTLPNNDFEFEIINSIGALEGTLTNLTLTFTNLDDNKVIPICPSSDAGNKRLFIRIPNMSGSALPSTGGMGTFLFIGVGVLLMGACVVYFIIRKKRKSNSSK